MFKSVIYFCFKLDIVVLGFLDLQDTYDVRQDL